MPGLCAPVGGGIDLNALVRGFGDYAFTPGYLVYRRWRQEKYH